MNYKKINTILIVIIISMLFLTTILTRAEGNKKDGGKNLNKTNAQIAQTMMDINNISTYFYNNGISDISPLGNSGFTYPKGSGKTAVFTSGLLWGAKITGDPDPRVGGTAYRTGLIPGAVLPNGTADDPTLDKYRIYRVRPDVYPGFDASKVDLSAEAANEGTTVSALTSQFLKDWTEWPADMGAPFDDKNNNGVYDPGVDVPGVPGADMTIWFVANDLNPTQTRFLYGANPLGLEVSETIWAYNRSGALGNMLFRKFRLINITNRPGDGKSYTQNTTFKDMYLSMWADIDLGDAGDDFVGVDTTLSLQYCYNANAVDAVYSPLPPPSDGFDFFQGPLVKGVAGEDLNKNGIDDAVDYGIFNGKRVGPGFINLPMTAAYYFANGDPNIGDPPQGNIDGSRQFYNFFQGKFGVSGQTFTDLATGKPTTFALNGDPQKGTGWLDGKQLPAGDRRQGSASGPFTMAPGDTQEVVVAELIAGAIPGSDRLSAIGLLKFYDQQAQLAYDNFFNLPTAPPAPNVNYIPLNNKIVIDWGEDLAAVQATETSDAKGFKFQGYNVYQLPTASASLDEAVRLATFDIIDGVGKIEDKFFDPKTGVVATGVRQFGNDTGIKRFFTVTQDAIKGGTPLINGIKYYFAVTSYNYNPDPNAVPNNLENPLKIVTVVPQSPDPGVSLTYSSGDTVKSIHSSGKSDGSVVPLVIDPTKLTGHQYKVTFDDTTTPGTTTWDLIDITANKTKLSKQTNLSGDDNYSIVDGLQVKVLGPPLKGKSWSYKSASPANISPVSVNYSGGRWFTGGNHGGDTFFGGVFLEPNFFGETSVTPDKYETVEIRFRPMKSYTDLNGNGKYDIGEPYVVDDPTKTQNAFMYTGFSGKTYEGFFPVPFTAWDVTDPANPRQLNVVIRDRDQNKQWDLHNQAKPADPLLPNNGDQRFNYTWITTTTYDPTGTHYGDGTGGTVDFYSFDGGNGIWDAQWTLWLDDRHTGDVDMLGEECTFTLTPNIINTKADVFTFSATSPSYSKSQAVNDVQRINVFPNPYYGVNSEELNKYNRFVTFSHLPANATIRIFNLAGVLVRTIVKSGGDQFQRWDLNNETGLPVASGLYIAYIEMPGIGATKILKLAVIQEQQILDRF